MGIILFKKTKDNQIINPFKILVIRKILYSR
jgi:hypothetical protein